VANPFPHNHWDKAYWTQLEAGVDLRLGAHVSLRFYAGASYLLDQTPTVVVLGADGARPSDVQPWLPYTCAAIGYALSP